MTLLWALVLVGVLVMVHELGHFALARLFDVKVLRLSFGFGPRLVSYRGRETEYGLAAIPVGGYVKMLGEDPDDEIDPADRGRAFYDKPRWQQLLIVLAGPVANLVLPAALYFHHFLGQESTASATIGAVFEGQPAAGVLRPGDRVLAIDDESVRTWDEMNRLVLAAPRRDLRFTIERPGEDRSFVRVVTPRAHVRNDVLGARETVGLIGVAPYYRLAQIGVVAGGATPSPAELAGLASFDVVTSVQGRPVGSWHDLEAVLERNRGESLVLTYLRPLPSTYGFAEIERLEPGTAHVFPRRVVEGGRARYESGIRSGDLFVHDVDAGSPAEHAGIRRRDELLTLDGAPIRHFEMLEQTFEEQPTREYLLGFRTAAGEQRMVALRLEPRTRRDEYSAEWTRYEFGAVPANAKRDVPQVAIEGRLVWAVRRSITTVAKVAVTTLWVVGKLLAGEVPASTIGGPIMLYHLAGVAAARGLDQLLVIAALISLNLGLLNLLPVPVLDGGTLLLMAIESALGRPIGRRIRERATWFGLALLGALMLLAARNDVARYWFPGP